MNVISVFSQVMIAAWDIMLASAVFILLGFFIAGLLKGFVPTDFIEKHLGGKKKSGIFKAAFFGVPIPL